MKRHECYWVYILLCENNTYYTGYTHDLAKRYQSHKDGSGKCKYTRSFKPLGIAQCWKIIGDKSFALQIERHIKSLSRSEKETLIHFPTLLFNDSRVQIFEIPEVFRCSEISIVS